jgi:hypothetical protein
MTPLVWPRMCCPALVAVAALMTGCGGGESAKTLSAGSIAKQERTLRAHLISTVNIRRAPAGSLERAFLSYWRTVQFADVDRAIAAYEPGLRKEITSELLALALRNASDIYRTQVPRLVETSVAGDTGVVRYVATTQASGRKIVPLSTSWHRTNGRWLIRYNSALDSELRIVAQSCVQSEVKPGSNGLDPRALRAGARAAGLQATYLQQLENDPGVRARRSR